MNMSAFAEQGYRMDLSAKAFEAAALLFLAWNVGAMLVEPRGVL